MKSILRSVALVALIAAQLSAGDRLFLFHDASATAFEAPSLARVGTVAVGPGAFAAFRASGGTYVVAADRVSIFDEKLQPLGEIALGGASATAAALDPHTAQLLVAAGGQLYRIDTPANRVASILQTGVEPSAIHIPGDARLAYLMTAGSRQAKVVNLETGLVLPGTADLAAIPQVVAGGMIGAGAEVFSAAPLFGGVGGPAKVGDAAPALLAASASGATLLRSNGTLLHVAAGGTVTPLTDPASGASPAAALRHAALSPNGDTAYLALADGRVLAMDAKGDAQPSTAWMASAPTAMALAPSPSQGGPTIIKVSGDQQAVVGGSNFNIVVNGPIGGIPMTVQSDSPAAQCDTVPPLSGNTTITCTANAVTALTTVTLTVSAIGTPVTFTIYVFPAGQPDGLFIISGNNQTVSAGASLALVAEARLNGLPRASFSLSVTEGSAVLSCPAFVTTNAAGRATINCTVAGSVPVSETATIAFSDSTNTVQFTANIVGQTGPNDALIKITPDPVTVFEGLGFNLTVQANLGGVPQTNVPLTISGGGTTVTCPVSALTGANGRATLACGANMVNADATVFIAITDGSKVVTYTVTVKNATVTDGFQKVSGDNQVVTQNTQFPMPLVVRAVTAGQPDSSLLLGVTVTGGAATCSVSTLTDANGLGSITCTAGTVVAPTQVQIQVKDALDRTLAQPFVATITPNQSGGQAEVISLLSGSSLSAQVGDTLTGAVRVRAETLAGTAVSGASIFARGPQGVTFNPAVSQTDANGITAFDVTFACAPKTGQIQLGLTSTTTNAVVGYTLSSGPLSQLKKIQGDGQSGVPGQRLAQALVVESGDQCGSIIPNVPITWTVIPPEAAALEVVTTTTNVSGRASVLVRPSTRGGAYQVRVATTQNAAIASTFDLTTQNTPSTFRIVSGNQQSVPAGGAAAAPLVVEVLSGASQPVQGVTVTFQVISGSASVGSATVTTNAQGRASTTLTAGNVRGPVTVRSTAVGRVVDFSLTVGGGMPQLQVPGFVNGASFISGFVAGSTGTIFGVNISGDVAGVALAPFDPVSGFPTLFRGVRVTVGGIAAPILSIANVNGQEQVNIQVPFGLAQGTVTVIVENNGTQASIPGIPIFGSQPGIFEYYIGAQRYAAALHANYAPVTPDNPARPGEVLLLFLTGLGRLTPPVATNEAGPVSPLSTTVSTPSVQLEGVEQALQGSYYAPQLLTVYQINFRVLTTTQPGSLKLTVSIDGASSQQSTLPVAAAF